MKTLKLTMMLLLCVLSITICVGCDRMNAQQEISDDDLSTMRSTIEVPSNSDFAKLWSSDSIQDFEDLKQSSSQRKSDDIQLQAVKENDTGYLLIDYEIDNTDNIAMALFASDGTYVQGIKGFDTNISYAVDPSVFPLNAYIIIYDMHSGEILSVSKKKCSFH